MFFFFFFVPRSRWTLLTLTGGKIAATRYIGYQSAVQTVDRKFSRSEILSSRETKHFFKQFRHSQPCFACTKSPRISDCFWGFCNLWRKGVGGVAILHYEHLVRLSVTSMKRSFSRFLFFPLSPFRKILSGDRHFRFFGWFDYNSRQILSEYFHDGSCKFLEIHSHSDLKTRILAL